MSFRAVYGSHPLHLLTLVAGFALFGYVLATIGLTALWNPGTWWQSIVVWFAAAKGSTLLPIETPIVISPTKSIVPE